MNATRFHRTVPLVPTVVRRVKTPTPRSRTYATRPQIGTDKPGSQSTKLSFRFGPKNVPVELWPMGFVIVAGLTGGCFAMYRHLSMDDLRHHGSGMLESSPHSKSSGSETGTGFGDGTKSKFISATEYAGDGKPVSDA